MASGELRCPAHGGDVSLRAHNAQGTLMDGDSCFPCSHGRVDSTQNGVGEDRVGVH